MNTSPGDDVDACRSTCKSRQESADLRSMPPEVSLSLTPVPSDQVACYSAPHAAGSELSEALQRLGISENEAKYSNLSWMTKQELLVEKGRVREELERFDNEFYERCARQPSTEEKQPMRVLYLYYGRLKEALTAADKRRSLDGTEVLPGREDRAVSSPAFVAADLPLHSDALLSSSSSVGSRPSLVAGAGADDLPAISRKSLLPPTPRALAPALAAPVKGGKKARSPPPPPVVTARQDPPPTKRLSSSSSSSCSSSASSSSPSSAASLSSRPRGRVAKGEPKPRWRI